jgi:hypothetical protein
MVSGEKGPVMVGGSVSRWTFVLLAEAAGLPSASWYWMVTV